MSDINIDEQVDGTQALRDRLAEVCGEGENNLGVVMTALTALLVDTALDQAEIEPQDLIVKFSVIVVKYAEALRKDKAEDNDEVQEALNEKGVLQWLN